MIDGTRRAAIAARPRTPVRPRRIPRPHVPPGGGRL